MRERGRLTQRTNRLRGHGVSPTTRTAELVVEEMHRPPARAGQRRTARDATASAMARARREGTKFKPPQMGEEGRKPLASPSTYRANLRNAKRKPAARRGRARRKTLQG